MINKTNGTHLISPKPGVIAEFNVVCQFEGTKASKYVIRITNRLGICETKPRVKRNKLEELSLLAPKIFPSLCLFKQSKEH